MTEDCGEGLSRREGCARATQGHRVHCLPLRGVGCNRVEGTWEKQGSEVKKTNLLISGLFLLIALASQMAHPAWGGGVETLKPIRHLREFPKLKQAIFFFFFAQAYSHHTFVHSPCHSNPLY